MTELLHDSKVIIYQNGDDTLSHKLNFLYHVTLKTEV